jgi:hypothetical protein
MAVICISHSNARASRSSIKVASSNEPPSPEVSVSYFTLPNEKDGNDYKHGSPSRSSDDFSSKKDDYGNGNGNSNPASEDASKYRSRDASREIDSQYVGYGDAAPSGCVSSSKPSSTRAPRRSAKKQESTTGRRASIGYTGEIEVKLPGRRNPAVRRRTSLVSFSKGDELKEFEHTLYGDASREIDSQYGYGDAAPSGCATSSIPSSTGTPRRRSSMKQETTTGRRASIRYTGEIEVKLPGRRDPVIRRTSLSFSKENEVREIERVSSLTDDSRALWFQKDELHNIKTMLRTIIGYMERGDEIARKLCTRGLECHIGRSTKMKINAAWDAVVLEQFIQQNKGSFDGETISMTYKFFARGSQEKAAERAKEDEAAIEIYQRDTRRMMRRMSMMSM